MSAVLSSVRWFSAFCTKAAAGLVLWWLLGKEKEPCEGGRRALMGIYSLPGQGASGAWTRLGRLSQNPQEITRVLIKQV